jgi:hypothetical protein
MALPAYAKNAKTPAEHHEVYLDLIGSSQGKGIPASMMSAMKAHAQLINLPGKVHAMLHKKITAHVNQLVRDDEISDDEASKVKAIYAPPIVKEGTEMELDEKKMSDTQMAKRKEIVRSMEKNFADFRDRYGERAEEIMNRTATKMAMQSEEVAEQPPPGQHFCAKHVLSNVFGEGVVLDGQHAEPDENGKIEWYTVQFEHGDEVVFAEDVEIMMAEFHNNHSPAKKKKPSKKA